MGLSSQFIESEVPSVKWFSRKDHTSSGKDPSKGCQKRKWYLPWLTSFMHSTKQGQWKVSCIQAYEQKSKNFTFHQSFLSEIFKNQTPPIQKLPRNITINMSSLSPDVTVRVRPNNNWSRKGKIISKCEYPRSYNVLTEKGTTLRRNRHHLLKTDEQFEVQPEIEYDEIDVSFTKQGSQVASEPSCTSSSNVQRSSVTPARSQPANTKDSKAHPVFVIEQDWNAHSNNQRASRCMNHQRCFMFSTWTLTWKMETVKSIYIWTVKKF